MRAMVLQEFGKPMVLEEVDRPRPKPHEALVRVRACGLCGTDVKVADGNIPTVALPVIPGHELAGEVVEVGSEVRDLVPGDHVVIHVYVTCGRCWYCRNNRENNCEQAERLGFERPGGFGEYVTAPERNCYKVSKDVPFEQACILSGTIATPFHALRHQARITVGDNVLIFGVGGLGIHAVQLARELGGRVLAVDIADEKLELARSFGAVAGINSRTEDVPARVRELTDGEGADVVVPIVGGNVLTQILPAALGSLRRCGRFVLLGYLRGAPVTVDSYDLVYGAWEIIGSRSSIPQDLIDVIKLVEERRIKPVIARTFPIEQANEALDLLRVNPPDGRIVLTL